MREEVIAELVQRYRGAADALDELAGAMAVAGEAGARLSQHLARLAMAPTLARRPGFWNDGLRLGITLRRRLAELAEAIPAACDQLDRVIDRPAGGDPLGN